MRWLFVSATIISSSRPRQKPCGELNCPRAWPKAPNLTRICIESALARPAIPFPWWWANDCLLAASGDDWVVFENGEKQFNLISSLIPVSADCGVCNKGDVDDMVFMKVSIMPRGFKVLPLFKSPIFARACRLLSICWSPPFSISSSKKFEPTLGPVGRIESVKSVATLSMLEMLARRCKLYSTMLLTGGTFNWGGDGGIMWEFGEGDSAGTSEFAETVDEGIKDWKFWPAIILLRI